MAGSLIRLRPAIAALLVSSVLAGPVAGQEALPQGGQVLAGSASIAAAGPALTIDQASRRAVIAWDSFSLGPGQTVQIRVPDAGSATLNRVTGAAPSTITGAIASNGQLFLVNPNGIVLTASGTVTAAGGFVASTLALDDAAFMAGTLHFAGSSGATVRNAGRISVGSGGFAALLGARVEQTGTLIVPLGRIGLGAGQAMTLDPAGDGFLQIVLPSTAAGDGSLLTAGGTLGAARIELRAADAAALARGTVNVPGTLRATGAHAEGGTIVIEGGAGSTLVGGTLDAGSGAGPGGLIELGGAALTLTGATLSAGGLTGGGTVRIGGGLAGAARPGLTAARDLAVDAATRIDASAGEGGGGGAGGTVVLWSDRDARIAGQIAAEARGALGDGGMVETSARDRLDLAPGLAVSAGSRGGAAGLWLIDPQDLTIDAAGAATISAALNGGTSVTATTSACLASYGTCSGSAGTIALTAPITKSAGGNATLTLTAGSAIALDAAISATAGQLALTLNAGAAISGSGAIATNGGLFTANVGAGSGLLSGPISGAGGLTKTGAGTLALSGANSYSGATTVAGGTLQAGSASAFGTNSAATVATGATLDLAGFSTSIGSLAGGGTVTNSSATAAVLTVGGANATIGFSGVLRDGAGPLGLTQTGTSLLSLSGANTFTGPLQINQGATINLAAGGSLATGTVIIGQPGGGTSGQATLTSNASNQLPNAVVTFNGVSGRWAFWNLGNTTQSVLGINDSSGNGVIQSQASLPNLSAVLTLTGSGSYSYNGFLRNTSTGANSVLSLVKSGSGTQELSGFQIGYTGPTTITSGTLALRGIGLNSAIAVNAGGTLRIAASANLGANWAVTLNDGATLTNSNPANWTVNNAAVTVASGASVSINQQAGSTGSAGVGLFLDGGLRGGGGGARVTINAPAAGSAVNLRNNATSFAGTLIVNGIASTTPYAGSGLAVAGCTTCLAAADLQVNGTLELGTSGLGWANPAATGFQVGSLDGAGAIAGSFGGTGRTQTLTTGFTNLGASFAGTLADGAGNTLGLTKTGTGTQTLAGSASFSGALTVSAGALVLAGSWTPASGTATTAVASGATLAGTGPVTASRLAHSGLGTLSLTGNNLVAGLGTSGTVGPLTLNTALSLATDSIASTGAIALTTRPGSGAALTLNPGAVLASPAAGTAVTLAADSAFINLSGAGAVVAPNGRWLVYAAGPAGNTFGGLDSGQTAVWTTSNGAPVSAAGNRYVFAFQPTVTFAPTSRSKTYGSDAGADLAGSYTISGLQPGQVGAYFGDTAAAAFAGAPVVSSAGAAPGAGLAGGPYPITIASGTLVARGGYALGLASPALLTVTPALLTITGATTRTRYSGAPQANGYAITAGQLFGDDTLTGVAGLATGRDAGGYADALAGATGSGLENYAISYANGSLTIDPAPLVLRGGNMVSTYTGQDQSNAGAVLAGVLGSDAFAITGQATGRAVGTYADHLGLVGLNGSRLANYALTIVPGSLTLERAPLTITGAVTRTRYSGADQVNGYAVNAGQLFGSDTLTGVVGLATGRAAGRYADALTGATGSGLDNYAISYANGSLTIDPAPLLLTYRADPVSSAYGGPLAGLSGMVSASGFVGGEGLADLGGGASWATLAGPGAPAGRHAISGTGLTSGNYAITASQDPGNAGAYTIDPVPLAIAANDARKAFDGLGWAGGNGVTFAGFVSGDGPASLGGTLVFGGAAQGARAAGSYPLTAGGLSNPNYVISWKPGTLQIDNLRPSVGASLWARLPVGPADPPVADGALPAAAGGECGEGGAGGSCTRGPLPGPVTQRALLPLP